MQWLLIALSTALFSALMDFFIKLSSGKIHDGLGGVVVNIAAVIPVLLFTLFVRAQGESIHMTKEGVIYSSLAGISVGVATVFLYRMFSLGTQLTLGTAIFRIGAIALASLLGILFLKDKVSLQYLVGFVLSIIGLLLIVTGK